MEWYQIIIICQLRGLVVKALAYEAWQTGFDSQLGHTKDYKNGASLALMLSILELHRG